MERVIQLKNVELSSNVSNLAVMLMENTLTYGLVANASHGLVTMNTNGTFTYTRLQIMLEQIHLHLKAKDAVLYSEIGTVTITIVSTNEAPVVTAGSISVNEDHVLSSTVSVYERC